MCAVASAIINDVQYEIIHEGNSQIISEDYKEEEYYGFEIIRHDTSLNDQI